MRRRGCRSGPFDWVGRLCWKGSGPAGPCPGGTCSGPVVEGKVGVEITLLLCFAVLLLFGVLISERAQRTVLSTAVLFLVGGFLLGPGVFDVIAVSSGDPVVSGLAELALFSVLFTDGMRVGFKDLRRAWRLPGRALLFGLPLTLALTAVFAHYIVGLPWLESFLLGAILAPTDPVFAAAIVGREEVPGRLRHLLNVESGVNDGLALPFVLVLLALPAGRRPRRGTRRRNRPRRGSRNLDPRHRAGT